MTAASQGVCREEFTTCDLEQAREFLGRAYGGRLLMARPLAHEPVLAVSHVETGSFALSDVTLPADLTFAVDTTDEVIISTVVEGTMQAEHGQATDRYRAGDVLIGNTPHAGHTLHTYGLRDRNITLPLPLLYGAAGIRPGGSGPPRFLSLRPASGAVQTQWITTLDYVGGLLADPDAAAQPLIIAAAARLLAATALTVFPNAMVSELTSTDRQDAHTDTLRRAVSFIDEHAHTDMTAADIAAAAHVTVRAVQLAFRRHLDMTPLGYLRRVRLSHAHQELIAADPAATTVTAVACRWGFPNSSRFAALYREAYGVTPTRTLHQE